MNIALVVDDFHGGAGNIAQILAEELSHSHHVSLVMTNLHSKQRYDLTEVDIYDENLSISGKNKIFGLISSIQRLKKLIRKKIKADLVISFLDNNNSLAGLALWNSKIPLVVSERSNPLVIFPKAPWDKIRRIAYRRADVVSVLFQAFDQFDGARFASKAIVTSNIVQTPPTLKASWDASPVRFVTFGRLSDVKRMDLMIELFDQAQREEPNIELHIFGDGANQAKLLTLIKEKNLSDKVFLRGYCNEVHKTLLDYDIYLMTSYQEGFPNSLCEAMAVGLPSIASACHEGISELCENGLSGVSVKEEEPCEFVKNMVLLARDPALREQLGRRAQTISRRYDKAMILQQWQTCMDTAVQRRNPKLNQKNSK